MKTLSSIQIQQLFLFCEQQGVKYYDVQVELVDHLAENIEGKINFNSSNFEYQLNDAVAEFGGSNEFKKIEKAKEKLLRRQSSKLQWLYILQYFRWPTILATTLVILFFYYLAYHAPISFMSVLIRICYWLLFIYYMILSQVDSKRAMRKGFSGGYRKCNYRQIKPLLVFKNSLFYFQTLAMMLAMTGIIYIMGDKFKMLFPTKIFTLLVASLVLFVICNAYRTTRRNLINATIKNYPTAYELKNNYENIIL
ncbi:hypothetical protein [Rhizosphaericola mali]|uniref:Uncharacterized protein n=1 Tax=Rhizosphaericola mali TaxID=2545455 RepID=A0A5P2FXN7_9BACT|nr:hypothetical protein [Rhizosphaericola mali]QES88246.1 hypothetical protein E0W69_006035 [Rhizosphaericola mali]